MVFVWFLYGSSTNSQRCITVPPRAIRVNDGGIRDTHDATKLDTVLIQSSLQCHRLLHFPV